MHKGYKKLSPPAGNELIEKGNLGIFFKYVNKKNLMALMALHQCVTKMGVFLAVT